MAPKKPTKIETPVRACPKEDCPGYVPDGSKCGYCGRTQTRPKKLVEVPDADL
ncbi:MAG: hypothetical protein ACYC63_04715 [Armatimonadota bacterium]